MLRPRTDREPIMAASPVILETNAHAKALAINLEHRIYGTFAEIGAGQEVARWFLRVGAASGTVAKTICAYDKTFSDKTYGSGTRYVSKERLVAMLDHEFTLLLDRLSPTRGADTCFFAFADTIATRNFKGDNEQHGWMGVRFQTQPGQPPSEILLHVNLMDPTAQLQQEALGVLGVNLVYAAFHQRGSAADFLTGLFDELSNARLEIDVIKLTGPGFENQDERLWCLAALRQGLAHAIVFDRSAAVAEPSGLLRKRAILLERGKFDSVEPYQSDMLRAADKLLKAEGAALEREPTGVLEMTIKHAAGIDSPDDAQILKRMARIAPMGPVIVSDYPQGYLLVAYLRRHTVEPVRFIVGVAMLAQLLNENYYGHLAGSLLEGIGRLLAENVKIYVYPMPADVFRKNLGDAMIGDAPAQGSVTVDNYRPRPPLDHLYNYLRDAGWIVPLSA
jgi:hypothetical protein